MNDIGAKIRRARKANNITQKKLAEVSGVSRRSINAIEAGTQQPSFWTVVALVNGLGYKSWDEFDQIVVEPESAAGLSSN